MLSNAFLFIPRQGSVANGDQISDEDDSGKIFKFVSDHEVSQDPEVALEKAAIPMRPDSITGLRLTDSFKENLKSHPSNLEPRPVNGASLLYPFMLTEAKREDNAPGFRAIEAQTAFPLYRLLKVQEGLRNACKTEFEPLVWFFCYQGEEWRLYAGTIEESSVVR